MRPASIYACLSNVAFPFVILPLYFKDKTLRYRFDEEGVAVSYGLIWRKETYLTYARIQDIHVMRNIFDRWLDLGQWRCRRHPVRQARDCARPGA